MEVLNALVTESWLLGTGLQLRWSVCEQRWAALLPSSLCRAWLVLDSALLRLESLRTHRTFGCSARQAPAQDE